MTGIRTKRYFLAGACAVILSGLYISTTPYLQVLGDIITVAGVIFLQIYGYSYLINKDKRPESNLYNNDQNNAPDLKPESRRRKRNVGV